MDGGGGGVRLVDSIERREARVCIIHLTIDRNIRAWLMCCFCYANLVLVIRIYIDDDDDDIDEKVN